MQHYFFAGWIPQADQKANFALANAGNQFGITATGPEFTVAPATQASTVATLWIGPKLPEQLAKQAPGFERALDYGIFTFLAEPIHWLLAKLHLVTGNWGWAIMLLVLLIKLALYPLSAAQYKSMAKMRKFQPRMQQLKERYGEDKQKYQTAIAQNPRDALAVAGLAQVSLLQRLTGADATALRDAAAAAPHRRRRRALATRAARGRAARGGHPHAG